MRTVWPEGRSGGSRQPAFLTSEALPARHVPPCCHAELVEAPFKGTRADDTVCCIASARSLERFLDFARNDRSCCCTVGPLVRNAGQPRGYRPALSCFPSRRGRWPDAGFGGSLRADSGHSQAQDHQDPRPSGPAPTLPYRTGSSDDPRALSASPPLPQDPRVSRAHPRPLHVRSAALRPCGYGLRPAVRTHEGGQDHMASEAYHPEES